MMAAVLYGKEHLQVEPVAIPEIERGDILVRVQVALTCGTDVKVFQRGYHARMIVPPAVFGHELAGDSAAVACIERLRNDRIADLVRDLDRSFDSARSRSHASHHRARRRGDSRRRGAR